MRIKCTIINNNKILVSKNVDGSYKKSKHTCIHTVGTYIIINNVLYSVINIIV